MKKTLFFLLFLICSFTAFSQNIGSYQYIVLPKKFSFFKEENKYNLNELSKMVFEKQGFTVYYDNDILPEDLAENRCKALYANMLEDNTLFSVKIRMELKDCKNKVVFTSLEGMSREKEFEKAYIQAFRDVGKSLQVLHRQWSVQPTDQKEIVVKENISSAENKNTGNFLFAQPISNGFQLVDSSPKIVMKLYKTSMNNVYLGQKEEKNGVVIFKNNQWFFEYYINEKLVAEKLEIKF